ncbi:uncharacterized protein [Spinacia oleracea]|uniref:Reelin domain-containing protein n=1 Tax=Spinacia oleracea TaxID=3562 RepID=A0ABM3QP66_SPIOL|nr:uncharacterized protein LOC130461173 [Spinacia oleracea]
MFLFSFAFVSSNGIRGKLSIDDTTRTSHATVVGSLKSNITAQPTTSNYNLELKWRGPGAEFSGIVIRGSFEDVYTEISVFKPSPVKPGHTSSTFVALEAGEGANFNCIQAGWTVIYCIYWIKIS